MVTALKPGVPCSTKKQVYSGFPLGRVPVLDDGDVSIYESGAIVEYVLARHGDGGLKPAVDSPELEQPASTTSAMTAVASKHFLVGRTHVRRSGNNIRSVSPPPSPNQFSQSLDRSRNPLCRLFRKLDRFSQPMGADQHKQHAADERTIIMFGQLTPHS